MNNKELGLWCRRGLLAYAYNGVSEWVNATECLSGGKVALIYYGSVALTFTVRHPLLSIKIEPVLACALIYQILPLIVQIAWKAYEKHGTSLYCETGAPSSGHLNDVDLRTH